MKEFMTKVKKLYSPSELEQIAKVLNAAYDPFMPDAAVWDLIYAVFPSDICAKIKDEVVGHKVINEILMKYYKGERIVKYHLVKEHLHVNDEVTLFEMYVDSSRLDIGRVNGESHAYEIKTELDTLSKLEKQINDYSRVYEYVYLVADPKHYERARSKLPEHCGIYIYEFNSKGCLFIEERPATKSPCISHVSQVKNLSSKDLLTMLRLACVKGIPNSKDSRYQMVLSECTESEIHELFKQVIKIKYRPQWSYLQQKFNKIIPIYIQTYFTTLTSPNLN